MSSLNSIELEEEAQLNQVLKESEYEYRRNQQLLEQRESEELQCATFESKALERIHSVRISSLERSEQEAIDLVIKQTQLLNNTQSNEHQLAEQERLDLELAIALSLNQENFRSSNGLNNGIAISHGDHSSSAITNEIDYRYAAKTPFQTEDDITESNDNTLHVPTAAQENLVDHFELLCHGLNDRIASTPVSSPLIPPPTIAGGPRASSRPSVSSTTSLQFPLSLSSPAPLLSPPSAPPTSSSSSDVDQLPMTSTDYNYIPTHSLAPPSPPRLLLGKPLPPVPDRSRKPFVYQTSNSDQDRSTSSRLTVCTERLVHSNSSVIQSSSSTWNLPAQLSSSSSSPMVFGHREDFPSHEVFSPQSVDSTYNFSPTESPFKPCSEANVSPPESFTTTTSAEKYSLRDSTPSSPATPNRANQTFNNPFDANPTPPENVTEGVQFGSIQSLDGPLVSIGQFPNFVQLTQFLGGSPTKITNPMFAIQAWSWNRLLTYLMWHGNSRIEPGPLDITEAEDERLGQWVAGVSVIFKEGEGEANVRLVLELVAGNGDSQWNRKEIPSGRRNSSVTIGPSNHGKRDEVITRSQIPEVIHLPRPFSNLPIQLSTLACNLHEIHSVSRMTSSMHTGITCSFKPNKNKSINMMIYNKLLNAIENNSRIFNEGNEDHQETDKLMKRGKKWLKKKTTRLASSMSPSTSNSSSTFHHRLHHSNSNINHNSKKASKVTKVDGLGLPLPDGATMVRPWDCDWC